MNENRSDAPTDRNESADEAGSGAPSDGGRDLDGELDSVPRADDEEDLEDDEDDSSDLDVLVALAELDAEAAVAYRIGASSVDDPAIRAKLEEFAGDHVRHVETINRLLADVGAPEVSIDDLDEGSSSITMLAAAVAGMGDRATLLVMIGNEQLTNSAYPNALELPFEDDVLRIFERHAIDERRHLDWLLEGEQVLRERGVEVGIDS